jgi:poly-gamma-glutamate synthesis protein (capsule biosynthesis protein)
MGNQGVKLMLVGDTVPNDCGAGDAVHQFEQVTSYLREGDLRCCQLETCLSDRGTPRRDVLTPFIRSPKTVDGLKYAGFDVITFAGNNSLDFGEVAFMDTLDLLRREGVRVVGAGENLSKANEHIVVERNGVRIAFVDRCSMLRQGYEATEDRPGIAPLEVKTFYEPLENIREQPGTPARTITIPDKDRLSELRREIQRADRNADVVVASFHWGIHFCHDLAMYQPEVAYEAIDAGADIVVGTHPHVLQAIDIYKGKPIFYSLGNFAFSPVNPSSKWAQWMGAGGGEYMSYYYMGDYPYDSSILRLDMTDAWRQSVLVKIDITEDVLNKISLRPVKTDENGIPSVVNPNQGEGEKIVKLLLRLSKMCGTRLELENDEVIVNVAESEEIDVRKIIKDRIQSYPSLCWIS